MSERAIPDDVKELLRASVHSFEELEVLLLLHREAHHAWLAVTIAEELHLDVAAVLPALANLAEQGLLAREETGHGATFRYAAQTAELANAVDHLAAIYARDRLQVVLVLSRNAMSRIQHSTLKAFSDAFRLRRDRGKGDKDG